MASSSSPSPTKSVTFDNNENSPKKQRTKNTNNGDDPCDDFSSSSVPTWARRGISWRSVREIFDEDFIPDDEKTEDLLELEMKHLDDTMAKYAMLYNIVGLNYLDRVCADVEPENRLLVHRQIHEQLTRELASRKQLHNNNQQQQQQGHPTQDGNSTSTTPSSSSPNRTTSSASADAIPSSRTGSVAFCFNCRESGHTHGVCTKPRRCYICHDPRHDAFVCIANPVVGSEFYDAGEKCAICGDRGHMSVRCKSRGGPWQGKPGYAHLPDQTYARPVVIHTGGGHRKSTTGDGGGGGSEQQQQKSIYNKELSILSSQQQQQQNSHNNTNNDNVIADAKSAREVILKLAQTYRKKDIGLMKLMREAELFCGSLSMLAEQNLSVTQRSSLRKALEYLRPSVAGVDLTTFGVVLNSKNQGVIASKKPKTSSGSNNVLDDEAALNELRTSSIDFNVVFGNHIERYSRSESSAEFRVELQKIQARTGLKPSDINLYDDDEVAARINKQVMLAAEAARKAQARTLQLQREIDSSSAVSGISSSRATSASSSHGTNSPNANNRKSGGGKSRTTQESAANELQQQQQQQQKVDGDNNRKTPLGKMKSSGTSSSPKSTTANIFKGTGLRHVNTLDPIEAEKRARGRREAAGEATLMRWTRLLSRGQDVTQVTSQEATSSTNTALSKQALRARAEEDLLRLMKAAVNKGDSSVIEGKKLKIPRVQHGTIGRDSIIRAWAEHKITPIEEPSPAASTRIPSSSNHHQQHRNTTTTTSLNSSNNTKNRAASTSSQPRRSPSYDDDDDAYYSSDDVRKNRSFRNNNSNEEGTIMSPLSRNQSKMMMTMMTTMGASGNFGKNDDKFNNSWTDLWGIGAGEDEDRLQSTSPNRRSGSMRRQGSSSMMMNDSPKSSFRVNTNQQQFQPTSPTGSPAKVTTPKSPRGNNNNNGGGGTKIRRKRQITVQIKDSPSSILKSPPLSPTSKNVNSSGSGSNSPTFENRSPLKRRPSSSSFPSSSSQPMLQRRNSSSGMMMPFLQKEQSGSGPFSLESSTNNNNNYYKTAEEEEQAKSRQIATPRTNYRNDEDKLESDIRLPKREENGEDKEEPIRNWNAHRVAMTWGKQQDVKAAGSGSGRRGGHNNNSEDKVDVWLMAKDRYNSSVEEARRIRDQKIEWGVRREESVAAKSEFESFMAKLGNPPPIDKVIDPDVVNKWKSRFQTARIKAGVKDAAIKESRLVHRSVVATARLGGAAVCDGATKRAERWLRSHRDVESSVAGASGGAGGSSSSSALLSEHSSMWTILCHRIAIAAVRVRAKKELAEELREFLSRLPKGRATQDESVRMVNLFEEMVYGDEISDQLNKRKEEELKKMERNASFADLMMMRSFPESSFGNSMNNNNNRRPSSSVFSSTAAGAAAATSTTSSSMKPKTTLDRCMEEWLLGNKRDEENKRKKLQTSEEEEASRNMTPHYAQAKDVDSQVRKANREDLEKQRRKDFYSIQQQREMIQRQHEVLEETYKQHNHPASPLGLASNVTREKSKFGSLTGISHVASSSSLTTTAPQTQTAGSPTFGSLIFSMSSSDDLLLQHHHHQHHQNGKPTAAVAAGYGSQRPSDLERLLSAPVTAQDVEKLIEKACRESYASLHDSDEWRRALPSNTKIWAKDDPRRSVPRTQEGESVASFLRWIVSPAATEGALGRIISKFTTQAGLFDFDLAFKEINPDPAVVASAIITDVAEGQHEHDDDNVDNDENYLIQHQKNVKVPHPPPPPQQSSGNSGRLMNRRETITIISGATSPSAGGGPLKM